MPCQKMIRSAHPHPGFSSSFQNHTASKKDHFPTTGKDGGLMLFPFFIQSSGKKRRSVATHALPIAFQEEYGGDSSLPRSSLEKF